MMERWKDWQKKLHDLAEQMIRERGGGPAFPEARHDMDRLLHEIQVHQAELEIQNEELRRAQRQLEEARNRYALLFRDAPAGFLVVGRDGMIRQANQAFADLAGLPLSKINGKPFSALLEPRYREIFLARFRAFHAQPKGKAFELRMTAEGQPGPFVKLCGNKSPAAPGSDGGGELILSATDITDRKLAELRSIHRNALLQSIRRMQTQLPRDGDRDALLRNACANLVHPQGYANVWLIGTEGPEPVIHASPPDGTGGRAAALRSFARRWLADPKTVMIGNPQAECPGCPVREGFGLAAAPLRHGKRVRGMILAAVPMDYLDDVTGRELLNEAAENIAFALESLEKDAERARLEEELRAGRDNLAVTLRSIGDAVISTDAEGRVTSMNPEAERLTGFAERESTGRPLSEILSLSDAKSGRTLPAPVDEVLREMKPVALSNHAVLTARDGTRRNVADSAAPIRDGGGETIGVVMVLRDVSGDYRQRRELDFQATLLAQIADLVTATDPEGRIVYVNGAVCRKLNRTRDELIGQPVSILGDDPAEGATQGEILQACREKGRWRGEVVNFDRDGHEIVLDCRVRRMTDEEGNLIGYCGVSTDITEAKRARAELEEQKHLLQNIIDGIPDIITLQTRDHTLFRANRAACEFTGKSEAELTGRKCYEAIGLRFSCESCGSAKAFLTGEIVMEERYFPHCNVWFEVRSIPIRRGSGDVRWVVEMLRDITARKAMEAAVHNERKRFKTLFEQAGDPILIHAADGTILEANQRACELTGLPEDQLEGSSILDLDTGRYGEILRTEGAMLGRLRSLRCETQWRTPEGPADIEAGARLIAEGDGEAVICIGRDIRDRKRAREEREITIEMLAIMNANSRLDGLMTDVIRLLRNWLNCDAAGIRLSRGGGYPFVASEGLPEVFLREKRCAIGVGNGGKECLLPECVCENVMLGRTCPAWDEYTEHGGFWTNRITDFLARYPEAERARAARDPLVREGFESVAVIPLRIRGETFGLLQINHREPGFFAPETIDLLERLSKNLAVALDQRHSLEALAEREEMYRALVETLPDIVARYDKNARHLFISPVVREFSGLEPDVFLGKTIGELGFPPEWSSAAENAVKAVLRTGEPQEIEGEFTAPNGLEVCRNLRAFPEFGPEGKVKNVVGVIRDVTAQKKSERELIELNRELESRVEQRTEELQEANRELESFSYSVSHDLRAPLRAVNSFSQALEEDFADRLDEEGLGYLRRIRANCERMNHLIEDLLNLSRVSRAEMIAEEFSLSHLVDQVLRSLMQYESGREVRASIAPGVRARADRRLLQLALENLIGNALKFTRHRDAAVIEFGTAEANGVTAYYIRDNGAGFDEKYADKLFAPFQRLHSREEFEGTGIGLATVQRIIRRHGGRVWAEGALDKGATFYFTLERD